MPSNLNTPTLEDRIEAASPRIAQMVKALPSEVRPSKRAGFRSDVANLIETSRLHNPDGDWSDCWSNVAD